MLNNPQRILLKFGIITGNKNMTYHFSAHLRDRGIGILSDSVVSFRGDDRTWSKLGNNPKTFVVSKYAAISCSGNTEVCLKVVTLVANNVTNNAVFSDIAPLIQEAYISVSDKCGFRNVEFILAARTNIKRSKSKLIKYVMKKNGKGLVRVEDQEHYTSGIELPDLEKELCLLLTENYKRTFGMEKRMVAFLNKAKHIIHSPKSFPLGICFGAFMPLIKEYVKDKKLGNTIGEPWTILLLPEDGDINFQTSEMYDSSKSVLPNKI